MWFFMRVKWVGVAKGAGGQRRISSRRQLLEQENGGAPAGEAPPPSGSETEASRLMMGAGAKGPYPPPIIRIPTASMAQQKSARMIGPPVSSIQVESRASPVCES